MGYFRAGFDVIGVDLHKQKNYPFPFVQADALNPPFDLSKFDAIHASPPCQSYSRANQVQKRSYPDLLVRTRDMLNKSGKPWVIENVPGAPIFASVMLCGSMFGMRIRRHRYFEFNTPMACLTPPCSHVGTRKNGDYVSWFGHGPGHGRHDRLEDARTAFGIDWMTGDELAESIPRAYTEFIGRQLIETVVR